MKSIFQLLVLTILLASCSSVPRDAQIHGKLIGTWIGPVDNLELTLNSDGNFVSTFTRDGLDYEFEGRWTLQDGVLVDKVAVIHSVNTKHTMHVGSFDTYTVVYVDSGMLVCESPNGVLRVYVRADGKGSALK